MPKENKTKVNIKFTKYAKSDQYMSKAIVADRQNLHMYPCDIIVISEQLPYFPANPINNFTYKTEHSAQFLCTDTEPRTVHASKR